MDAALDDIKYLLKGELMRVADPDRPDANDVGERKNLCMEAKKIRGPEMVRLMSQVFKIIILKIII